MPEAKQSSRHGKPWNKHTTHDNYEDALSSKNDLIEVFKEDFENNLAEAKIKRNANGVYLVKTRFHEPEAQAKPKKEKKRGKNSRRNRQNTD